MILLLTNMISDLKHHVFGLSRGYHRAAPGNITSCLLFGWERLVFLPEDIALSTVAAASRTSAALEIKIVHVLASDSFTICTESAKKD